MCGRYALHAEERKLRRRFGAEPPPDLSLRYNVAPTQTVPILRREGRVEDLVGLSHSLDSA